MCIATSLGDVLVLVVTWVKTVKNLAEGARIGIRTPLSTMLFRDGALLSLSYKYNLSALS